MKDTKKILDNDIIKFSLEGIKLANRMQECKHIKQGMFFVSVCEVEDNARIAPVVCGDSRVMAVVLSQVALQDKWVKDLFIETHKLIQKNNKLPTIKIPLDHKD